MQIRSRRWMAIAVGALLALVVLAWAFDWNWVRPSIERHLTEASGRPVHIDDLRVGIDRHFDVTVRLRGVNIANAPWADTREPMAAVGEAQFSMSARSVWERRPVVSRLLLIDGRLDLQRQADGLRNWRLTHPDDRGPGHVVIQAIEARRTSLRFAHRGIDLDMVATAAPIASDPKQVDGAGLATLITFMGRYGGEKFGGDVATGPEITIQGTGRTFPLRGQMNAAGSRLAADVRAADVFRHASLDGQVHVEGPSLARLRKFLRAPLPESRPFTIDADLKKSATEYTFAKVRARIGTTPVTGELAYDVRQGRPWVEATLRSDVAQWDDLRSLLMSHGAAESTHEAPTGTTTGTTTERPAAPPSTRTRTLGLERLNHVDARFDLAIGRLVAVEWPAIGGVRFKVSVDRGRLEMNDLDIALAEGRATGTFSLDASGTVPAARAALAWQGVQVERVVRRPESKRVTGRVEGRIELQAVGDSIDALAASTRGSAAATLRQGSLSRRLDAELGLDGARLLGSWFGADRQVPVRCASVAFDVAQGVARARTIAIDTATTHITGNGSIDLRASSIAMSLTPRARQPGLLTLDRSIAVSGALTAPKARVVDRVEPVASTAGSGADRCGPA